MHKNVCVCVCVRERERERDRERACRLARHSTGLKALGYTFRKSYKELGLLSLFIMIALLVFASLVYYLEHIDNPKFSSIPTAAWCALHYLPHSSCDRAYSVSSHMKMKGTLLTGGPSSP